MAIADHLRVRMYWRGVIPYWHHGIDMGDGTVIHYSSGLSLDLAGSTEDDRRRLESMEVRRTSLEQFTGGRGHEVVLHNTSLPADEVLTRAESCLGDKAYLLSHNNCEHFAHWCKTGTARSWQVEGIETAAFTAASAAAKGALALAAKREVSTLALKAASTPLANAAKAIKPVFLLADLAEYSAYIAAQKMGYSPETSRSMSRWTGRSTAAAIGMVSGGPAGAAAAVTVHEVTGKIAEKLCECVKLQIKPEAGV